ncbi:MAG: adenosylmethionine decarboxylase [Proteobacteria bacterium]|nr:adenosylmethionine decarboxylase [Pseudomonadota bacterium]
MACNVGRHVLVDLHGCNPELLKRVDFISKVMYEAAKQSEATIVGKFFKQFEPWGVSGVIIIAESHISIHTWPEHGLASIDYFSCSEAPKIDLAIQYLKDVLEAKTSDELEVHRGDMHIKRAYSMPVSVVPLDEMAV